MYTIYSILIDTNIYFGITKNRKIRWQKHICDLKRNKHHNKPLQECYINRHSEPEFNILHERETVEEALRIEKEYIDSFPNSLNRHPGGCAGRKYLGKGRKPRKTQEQIYSEKEEKFNKWLSVRR